MIFGFIFAPCISRTTVLFIYQSSHYLLHKDILNTVLQHCCLSLKILTDIDKTYRILNYTRIKPRSRPPQKKKSTYFTHPDFSAAKLEKSAQITRVNAVHSYDLLNLCFQQCTE